MSSRRLSRYTDEFRLQIIKLYESGKSVGDISKEYGIASSTIHGWIIRHRKSGSFKKEDNLSELEKELRDLRKLNKQLLMENDILKQAALLMARK